MKGSGSEILVPVREIRCVDKEQNPSMVCSIGFQSPALHIHKMPRSSANSLLSPGPGHIRVKLDWKSLGDSISSVILHLPFIFGQKSHAKPLQSGTKMLLMMKCTSLPVTGPRARLYGKKLHYHLPSPPTTKEASMKFNMTFQNSWIRSCFPYLLLLFFFFLMASYCVWCQHLNTYWFT